MWSTEILLLIGLAPVDHLALALADRRHVGRDGAGYHAEVRALARQMRDPRAPNLVLAGQAGDVGAGAADPPALDDGSPPPRLRHVPSQVGRGNPRCQHPTRLITRRSSWTTPAPPQQRFRSFQGWSP